MKTITMINNQIKYICIKRIIERWGSQISCWLQSNNTRLSAAT